MNPRSEAILEFLGHGFWMTPSLIHENMDSVTWTYNTTLNRLRDLEEKDFIETHDENDAWYRLTVDGETAVG